jgi:hypothetical protein
VFVILCALVTMPLSVMAEETTESAKPSELVNDLASKLSLKPEQALGAAGAVFALAKSKMTATDFTKLASGFPEMESLLKAAPSTSAAPSGSGTSDAMSAAAAMMGQSGAAGLLTQFGKLGIPIEAAAKIVPEVLSFVKGKQGDEMMGLLSKAIQ